jgi:ABC-type multidrug transport system permease subunit
MNEQEFKKRIDQEYDPSRENSLLSMAHDFYNKKMRSIVILVWVFALIFIAGAVVCAILFVKTDQVKSLILYATLFIVCVHWLDLMKIFAWQMIHRNSLKREIKRLELGIAELTEAVKNK